MANAGRILIMPKGEYDANETYEMLDLVYSKGLSWLAKKTVTGIEPTEGEFWHPLFGTTSVMGQFQRFEYGTPFTSEDGDTIALSQEKEKTGNLFTYVDGSYIANCDMTVHVKADVYATTHADGEDRLYVVLMYTPVGGEEERFVEDVSYGKYSSVHMSRAKVVKKGDKFRLHNLTLIEVNGGFLCRPSCIEFIRMV